MRKVLLTPIGLWWEENDKAIVIFIRDPKTEEIVEEAVTSAALADKTGMSQEKARQIFQEAYAALERRMGGRSRGAGEKEDGERRGPGDKVIGESSSARGRAAGASAFCFWR